MKNMTKGKPLKLIFLFAFPLMLGNILQQLYTMVDTMIVGQFLGVNALASLGAADWINWAILGIVMVFTQGFSIRISRTFGAEDYGNMKRSMHMVFFLYAFFSILTTVVAELSIVPLLTLLNTPSNVIQGSITYLRIMSGGLTITMFYNCFSSILRSLGDSRTPLLAMIGGAITNICLDLLFVVIFKWGIAGAAIATGGKKISKCQIDKLTRLCVPLYFVFDKDVQQEELKEIADRFIDEVEVYALIDKDGILNEKESPTDEIEKFKKLLKNNVYRLK